MKRFLILLAALLAPVVLAPPAPAAVEFKASGHMHILLGVQDNGQGGGIYQSMSQFDKNMPEDNFYAGQRFRPRLTMKAEGVSAVFEAQQYDAYWGSDWPVGGNPGISGTSDGRSDSVRLRQAYLDFMLPGTPISLKAGFQPIKLPSIFGNPVFDNRAGGVALGLPLGGSAALSLFYARTFFYAPLLPIPIDPNYNSDDIFGFILPLGSDQVRVTPYFIYGRLGMLTANDSLYAGGFNLELSPAEALSLKFDAIVTHLKNNIPSAPFGESTGWMLVSAADYQLAWGRPGLFAWYASGSDKEGKGGLFSYSTAGFGPTSLGTHGYSSFTMGDWVSQNGTGTWGAGAQLADLAWFDGLRHTLRLAYIRGTSEAVNPLGLGRIQGSRNNWTKDDWFVELNLDSIWSIHENLSAVIELGAILPHVAKGWRPDYAGVGVYDKRDDLAWRAQVALLFSF